jgi:hypothetical protein
VGAWESVDTMVKRDIQAPKVIKEIKGPRAIKVYREIWGLLDAQGLWVLQVRRVIKVVKVILAQRDLRVTKVSQAIEVQ